MKPFERYNAQRGRALSRWDQNKSRVFSESPQIEALWDEKAGLFVQKGLAAARGEATAEIDAQIADINGRIRALLVELGYGEDFLEYRPECELCSDTGFYNGEPCSCSSVEGEGLALADFDTDFFPEGPQRRQAQKIYKMAQKYVEDYSTASARNILLIGPTGMGKTYTLRCIAGELARRGVVSETLTAYELIQSIMNEVIGSGNYGYLRRLERVPLLVLDDLGTEPKIPNITNEYMFGLINERMVKRAPMLIASNLMPGEIAERYGERITSRLFDISTTRAYELAGEDMRTYKRG